MQRQPLLRLDVTPNRALRGDVKSLLRKKKRKTGENCSLSYMWYFLIVNQLYN